MTEALKLISSTLWFHYLLIGISAGISLSELSLHWQAKSSLESAPLWPARGAVPWPTEPSKDTYKEPSQNGSLQRLRPTTRVP